MSECPQKLRSVTHWWPDPHPPTREGAPLVTRHDIENLIHPLVRSDDLYEMKEAIAFLERIGGKEVSRPNKDELRLGRITFEPKMGCIFYDGDREHPLSNRGLGWLEVIWGERPCDFSSIYREGDSKQMTEAIEYLIENYDWPERDGDELIIDNITYHPDSGAIWLDGRRDTPSHLTGLRGLKSLIWDRIMTARRQLGIRDDEAP